MKNKISDYISSVGGSAIPEPVRGNEGLETLLFTNIIYTFIVAGLAVMVPLYLLHMDIDLAGVGLILSLMPIAFLVLRILFASIADEAGTRSISLVYALSNILAIAIYLLAATPFLFAIATFAEGARASGFWAISRTDVIIENGRKATGKILAYFSGFRQLADALGRIAIGFMIAWLSFQNTFIFMLALSIILLVIVLLMKNGHTEFKIGKDTVSRIFRPRTRFFWNCSIGITFVSLASNVLVMFILPLYLFSGLSMDYQQTGALVALFSLVTAVTMLAIMKTNPSPVIMLFLTLSVIPLLVIIPYFGNLLPLLILLAIGHGASIILQEYLLTNAVSGSKDVSTEVGVIFVPLRVGEFLFLSLGGFVVMQWGFASLFVACALLYLLFIVFALKNMGLLSYSPART